MVDIKNLSPDQLKQIEDEREIVAQKAYGGFFAEPKIKSPIYQEMRFNHGYWHLRPFLINNYGDKFELSVYDDKKHVHLAFIGVDDDHKREGRGTGMMVMLCDIADTYGYSIDLEVDAKFGTSKRVLTNFYKKFGFIKGEWIDQYIRKPKNKEVEVLGGLV